MAGGVGENSAWLEYSDASSPTERPACVSVAVPFLIVEGKKWIQV